MLNPPLALNGSADRYDHREDTDYYSHAGALFRLMSEAQKALLISNIAGTDGRCQRRRDPAPVAVLLQG